VKTTLSFDDVLLVPKYSDIISRAEIDISSGFAGKRYDLPIISSPMDTVTESSMAISMSERGALGIIHRYSSVEEQTSLTRQVSVTSGRAAAAVGVTGDFEDRATALYDAGARILCIDVAHGHHILVKRALKKLRDIFGEDITLIAGNVASAQAFSDLESWGADAIRVGIGGGSICSTRIQTGHGTPTFQSVLDCGQARQSAKIIADGGIRTAGDMVKAIAAGADFVMLGSLLAGTDESPGSVFIDNNTKKYKVYRGMASRAAQQDWRGRVSSLEGITTTIPYKGPVDFILTDLAQNIRSGFSYSGARTIKELRDSCKFIRQTPSGTFESGTHILEPR